MYRRGCRVCLEQYARAREVKRKLMVSGRTWKGPSERVRIPYTKTIRLHEAET